MIYRSLLKEAEEELLQISRGISFHIVGAAYLALWFNLTLSGLCFAVRVISETSLTHDEKIDRRRHSIGTASTL